MDPLGAAGHRVGVEIHPGQQVSHQLCDLDTVGQFASWPRIEVEDHAVRMPCRRLDGAGVRCPLRDLPLRDVDLE